MGTANSPATIPATRQEEREALKKPQTSESGVPPSPASLAAVEGADSKVELWLRQGKVFYTAMALYLSYKRVQWKTDQMPEGSDVEQDALWEVAHVKNSKRLYKTMVNLEGFWVKCGQFLSSRADVLPKPYTQILAGCQDALPSRSWTQIKGRVEKELGQPLDSLFESVDEMPLACASIAQVHRAVLKGGRQVVIKVQHKAVAKRLLQDLRNLETIGNIVRYFDADFDFSPVVREWAKSIPNELDFEIETANTREVEAKLRPRFEDPNPATRIACSFAQIIDPLVARRVMVMSFIDGFKVDDLAQLDRYGADRTAIVGNVTRAYAQQIFCDGLFSADPHPGNILVHRETLDPVLLDFGLVKRLDDPIRLAFARLLVAASEADTNGVLTALEVVGLKVRADVPFDVSLLVRFLFRDAKPADEAKDEMMERRSENKAKVEAATRGLYLKDMVDVTFPRMLPGFKQKKKGEVVAVHKDDTVTVRLTTGKEQRVPKESCAVQKGRSPIDAWPDAFIFFDRVLGLLRGLAATLNVELSYIQVMTPYARSALHESPDVKNLLTDGETPVMRMEAVSGIDTLGGIKELLQDRIRQGFILGAQVVVLHKGEKVVDLCAGIDSPYSLKPVKPDTLFNVFSAGKGIVAAAVHILVRKGIIDLDAPVVKYWPEFANCDQNGSKNGRHGLTKKDITVRHVLNHQAGMVNAGLDALGKEPFMVRDEDRMIALMEKAVPTAAPGAENSYHYLSFGWLVGGIVRGATGKSLRTVVDEEISDKVGLLKDLFLGLPEGGTSSPELKDRLATLVIKRPKESISGRPVPKPATKSPPKADESAKAGDVVVEEDEDAEAERPFEGASMLLNPTFFNAAQIREGFIPAGNTHTNARSLAAVYQALFAKGGSALLDGYDLAGEMLGSYEQAVSAAPSDAEVYTKKLGFEFYPPIQVGAPGGIGHHGMGGSQGMAVPGEDLYIGIAINKLTAETSETTWKIVDEIYKAVGLEGRGPVPARARGDI